jgi:hypothetical protein
MTTALLFPLDLPAADLPGPVRVRPRTESMFRLSKRRLAVLASEIPVREHRIGRGRPKTWGGCVERGLGTEHPCPFVSCKHHLAVDVNPQLGSIKTTHPGEDLDAHETCSLALSERGGMTLEAVSEVMNLTRERIRQIEGLAIAKLKAAMVDACGVEGVDDLLADLDGPVDLTIYGDGP